MSRDAVFITFQEREATVEPSANPFYNNNSDGWSMGAIFSISVAALISIPMVMFMVYYFCRMYKMLDYVSVSADSLPHKAANKDDNTWLSTSYGSTSSTDSIDNVKFYIPSDTDELSEHWIKRQYMPLSFQSSKPKPNPVLLNI